MAAQSDFISHAENKSLHLTEEEREVWNAKADASALSGKVDTATFTAHATNTTVHVSQEEKEKWNARTTKGVVAATQDGLDEHTENTAVHLAEEERTAWNTASAIPSADNVFTGDNTHAGPETFNGTLTLNGPAIKSVLDVAQNSVASNESSAIMSYVHWLHLSKCFYIWGTTSEICNEFAFMGAKLTAPSSSGTPSSFGRDWIQDSTYNLYRYRIEWSSGTAIHFGVAEPGVDGDYQSDRPYMLFPAGNMWTKCPFVIVGIGYHNNSFAYMLMYDTPSQEIIYAEILVGSFKTFAVHCRSYQYLGEMHETIYSGFYTEANLMLTQYRVGALPVKTAVVTRNNGKRPRLGGCKVFANSGGYGKKVQYRAYAPEMYSYKEEDADKWVDAVAASLYNTGITRSLEVTQSDGLPLPEAVSFPAEGGEFVILVCPHTAPRRHDMGRTYVQPLDEWVASSKGNSHIEANKTENVTITVASNEDGKKRKSWVLIGQFHAPAFVIKVVQDASAPTEPEV